MALQKQTVSLPFTQGVDTKTDDKLSVKLSRLENMVFRGGTLDKRYGTSLLTANIDTGGTFSAGEQLLSFDSELVRINGGTTYSLAPGLTEWITRKGGGNFTTITNTRIQRNTRSQFNFDQALCNGIWVCAWQESGAVPGIHVCAMDITTNAFLFTGNAANPTGTAVSYPRCVAVGTTVFVFWMNQAARTISYTKINTAAPVAFPGITTLVTDLGTGSVGMFDVWGSGNFAYLAYTAASPNLKLIKVDASGAVVSGPATASADAANNALVRNVKTDSLGNVFVFYDEDVGISTFAAVFSSSFSLTGRYAINGQGLGRPAVCEVAPGTMRALYAASVVGFPTFGVVTLNASGVTATMSTLPNTTNFQITLASDGVLLNGTPVVAVVNSSSSCVQPTGYLMDFAGNAVARVLPGLCGSGAAATATIPRPITMSGGVAFLFPETGRLTYQSVNGSYINVTPTGITRVLATPVSASLLPINRLGDCTYIGGALPYAYDGAQVYDVGFWAVPIVSDPFLSLGGNLTQGATYQYRAVYSWLDARGQLCRSPPSPALSVAIGTGTGNYTVAVDISCMPLDSKNPNGPPVQVELYRTTGNGTVFYRTPFVSYNAPGATGGVVGGLPDGLSDAALQGNELLYTTGGILDWLPPPAHKYATVFKSRLVVGGLEDPFECRFSSQVVRGEAVRFNEVFSIRVPSATGPVVALATLDDKLIIFTSQTAYAIVGDGPDNLGNNPFPQPQQILPVDAGPTLAQSVATIPDGVVYQTARGIMLLDRSLNVQYLGADVEAYTSSNTVRSALLRPEVQQLWLLCDSGNDAVNSYCLVWDYFYKQWSVLTVGAGGGQASCYYQGKYTRVRSNGSVLQEQPGTYLDTASTYSGLIQTNWIKLAGLQGFQRLWRATLLGKYNNSDFTLQWQAQVDYQATSPGDTISFNTSGVFGPGIVPLQVGRHMAQQKCESVRFTIADSLLAGDGHGMSLTGLELEYGVKRGAYKLPAAQSI